MDSEKYRMEGHRWFLDSNAGKHVCAVCGLIRLRNRATDWCVERGCLYKLHPSYKSSMRNLTKMPWS
ncbi:hypothetical protein NDAWWUGD_CDS0071 [Salmonella phage SeKF_80]|uniref:Uncharacterized protein n=1 Tax=Salmonella phage 7-11 TaxID=1054968 RepID=G0X4Z4_9CAUD|nr:hypothetical protein SaPh711_gp061 [Salmonella phage 7-11]AEK81976.1 hypothetical protein [Salmonella phage 7-11]